MFKISLVFIFYVIQSICLAESPWSDQPQSSNDILKIIKDANQELIKLGTPSVTCDIAQEKSCKQSDFCNYLSTKKNSYHLYENADGEYIPNFVLTAVDTALKNCANLKVAMSGTSDFISFDSSPVNVDKLEKAKRYKAFQAALIKNNEQGVIAQIELARSDIMIEKAEKGVLDNEDYERYQILQDPIKAKKFIEGELAQLETRAGVKLSDESRELYIAYNTYTPSPFDTRGKNLTTAKKEDPWISVSPDPFLDPLLLTTGSEEDQKKFQSKYQKSLDKTYDVFLETQKDLIGLIEAKRNKLGSDVTDAILIRLKTVGFAEAYQSEVCSVPNAFYNPIDHKMTLCPQVLMLPKESLKMIVAHELGHSFDPCVISASLFKTGESDSDSGLGFGIRNNTFRPIPQKIAESKKRFEYENDMFNMQSDITGMTTKGIAYDKNPFNTLITCLASPRSMGARLPDYSTLEKKLDLSIQELEAAGATKKNNANYVQLLNTKSHFKDIMKSKYACSFIPGAGNTEVQEAFADWIAGEIIASDLSKTKPEKKRSMAFESLAFFLGMDCKNVLPDLGKTTQDALKFCMTNQLENMLSGGTKVSGDSALQIDMENFTKLMTRAYDPHPRTFTRIDRLFMAQPELRQTFGCSSFEGLFNKGIDHCDF